jgi:hypothetical protein
MSKTFTTALRTAFLANLTATENNSGDFVFSSPELDAIVAHLDAAIAELASAKPIKTLKRARTGYQLWKGDTDVKLAYREAHPDESGAPALNKGMGLLWKGLADSDRAPWLAAASEEREVFIAQKQDTDSDGDVPKKVKRARSAYMFYKMDQATKDRILAEHPDTTFVEQSKIVAGWWKGLGEEDLAPYKLQADEDKDRVKSMKAMETPDEATTTTTKKKKKTQKPKTSVKRARSAFVFYKMDQATKDRVAAEMQGAEFADKSKTVAAWWKELDEDELAPYKLKATEDKDRHATETKAELETKASESESETESETKASESETEVAAEPSIAPPIPAIVRSVSAVDSHQTPSMPPQLSRSVSTSVEHDTMPTSVVKADKVVAPRGPTAYQLFKKHQTQTAKKTNRHFPDSEVVKMSPTECRMAWNELDEAEQTAWVEKATAKA